MSGGVDSSVAALMMKQKGYEVIGAFMKNYSDSKNDLGICKWQDDRKEAMKIASMLKIPLITLDFEKEYKRDVVDSMFKLYKRGITPNPDVDCNNKVKFPLLWKAAKKLGCSYIVTGHYVRIKKVGNKKDINNKSAVKVKSSSGWASNFTRTNLSSDNQEGLRVGRDGYELLRAKDESKDQSYFLYRLTENDLSHTLFPIGDLTKVQVRKIAKKNEFPNSERKSTVGICFIGKVNLKKFLQKKIKPKKGKILNPQGIAIGEHDGIYYYTIGQRIGPRFGLEIEKGKETKRWYVASKNLKRNELVAAPEGHKLNFRKEIFVKNIHWINKKTINNKSAVNIKSGFQGGVGGNKSLKVLSRIRQVGELLPSKLFYDNKARGFKVILNKPIVGISTGQAIVLYRGTVCIGGGVIGF